MNAEDENGFQFFIKSSHIFQESEEAAAKIIDLIRAVCYNLPTEAPPTDAPPAETTSTEESTETTPTEESTETPSTGEPTQSVSANNINY